MKNNYVKHFLVIGIGTFLSMFVGFITTPVITRIVAPIDYGRYSIFVLYSNIAVMVLCMGLDQALVRYYYESPEKAYKSRLLRECMKNPIRITIAVSGLIIVLTYVRPEIFEFSRDIIVLLCVFTVVQLVYRFFQLLIRLEYNSKLYSQLNIINKVLYVVFVLFAIRVIQGHYLQIMSTSIIAATMICLGVSIVAQRDLWFTDGKSAVIVEQKILIKYGAPYIVSMGITMLFQACDQLALNYFCDYTEVGIYASAMTLVHIFAIIQTTFNTLWAPMAVEHYSEDSTDKTFYQKGNQAITVIMFSLGVILIMVKDIFVILLGEKYREAAVILPFLIFNPIMYTISETTVSGLVFKKKSNMQVVIAVGVCVTNIIGNWILVPGYGCAGAAISTGISYIVFFTLRTILSNRYFYVDYKLKKFYIVTSLLVLYAFYNTFSEFNRMTMIGGMVLFALIIFLYWDSVKWMYSYGLKWIKSTIKSKENM